MYYTIYQTTNLINNKVYVGLHETENPNDKYLGSGIFLKKAIKKYGIENFKKEILYIFNNKFDMIKKEIDIVDDDFIKKNDTYNFTKGGFGLSTLSEEIKEKTIKKISTSLQKTDLSLRAKKRILTQLNKDVNCFKKIGIKSSLKQKQNYKNGYINPNTNFNKINIYNHKNEIVYTTLHSQLHHLCVTENLPERAIIKSLNNNGIPLYYEKIPKNLEYLKFKNWYALYENKTRINLDIYYSKINEKKKKRSEVMSIKTSFNNINNRGKRPSGSYEVYNEKNILIYSFTGNKTIELNKLKLPTNTFNYSFRNKKRITKGVYKNWYMIKL